MSYSAAHEDQISQVVRWFAFWNAQTRRIFLNGLIDRAQRSDPPDPTAEITDRLTATTLASCVEEVAHTQQVLQAFLWFRDWPDRERNALMDLLEDIDITAVYNFYDRFAATKWK